MNPSVMIAIPSGTDWKADFGMSLAGLMASLGRPLKNNKRIEVVRLWNTKGSILSRSRQTLVQKAREEGVSHGTKTFSDAEAAELRSTVAKMFALNGDEVYEAGLPIFRATLGQFDA